MKNQYYADVNDYRKYGLIRCLLEGQDLNFGVGWMLTPDDSGPDGRFTDYALNPTRWRGYDPALFDHLASSLERGVRDVSEIETSGLLPRATFMREVVPDDRKLRTAFSSRLLIELRGSDLVFLDPDNGIEVQSKPSGRKGSGKYVLWRELQQLFEAGTSLLIYQHYPRRPRQQFHSELKVRLAKCLGCSEVTIFATSNVAFVLALHEKHRHSIGAGGSLAARRWLGQVTHLQ